LNCLLAIIFSRVQTDIGWQNYILCFEIRSETRTSLSECSFVTSQVLQCLKALMNWMKNQSGYINRRSANQQYPTRFVRVYLHVVLQIIPMLSSASL
jgi:hypothetical protein